MSHSVDDQYAEYIETLVCAETEFRCDACREPVAIGHCYWRVEAVIHEADPEWDVEEEIETHLRCIRCQTIHVHLRELGEKYEVWPSERLDCGEEYTEHWGKEPPPEIAELAFVTNADLQTPELQAQALSKHGIGA